ncbi:MAG: FG-GAP repeat protein, partial [Planctomycetes bacterium]|nr:FG-GAP repeat protein [Planctomycetota bacterium]
MKQTASKLPFVTLVALVWCVGSSTPALGQCEITPVTVDDGVAKQKFGWSTAISGDYAVVGTDEPSSSTGAAYIYERDGLFWNEIGRLVPETIPPEPPLLLANDDEYGRAVAISGRVAVVGARKRDIAGRTDQGAVYVFRRDELTGEWAYQQELTAFDRAAGDLFGSAVAIDGDWIVVGAPDNDEFDVTNSGTAYAFHFDGVIWKQARKFRADNQTAGDRFGNAVAISSNWFVVGIKFDDEPCPDGVDASNSGSVYPFFHDPAAAPNIGWEQRTKLQAQVIDGTSVSCDAALSDNFGHSVAISGDRIVVGAVFDDDNGSSSGSAYIYRLEEPEWVIEQKLTASDGAALNNFGRSVAIHGDLVLVGASKGDSNEPVIADTGSVYIYRRAGTTGTEEQELTASDAVDGGRFGWYVSIGGDYAAIGGYKKDFNTGAAYVFAVGIESDCNENGVHDDCDILADPSVLDSDNNGILDSCECSNDADCGDGLDCTIDSCGSVVPICTHDLIPGFCAIDDACYVGEEVDPLEPCRICDPALNARQWSPRANGIPCTDDDLFCTGPEICQSGLCMSAGDPCAPEVTCNEDLDRCDECFTDADCDDIAACTVDSCVGGLCLNEDLPDGTPCTDNGVFCDGVESCFLGQCLSPGNPCLALDMFCDSMAGQCAECLVNGDCDDGNECTSNICTAGECVFDALSAGVSCGDDTSDACTTADTCDGLGTCLANHVPDGTICETDGNDCTEDTCAAGACTHPPHPAGTPCGDQADNDCTAPDTCNGFAACAANHEMDGTLCPDGVFCNGEEICIAGVCESTGGACAPPTAFCHEATQTCRCSTDADCDDGRACTGVEFCDGDGVCRHEFAFDCDGDGVPDGCDKDCNANDVPDECDILDGTSLDCQL